MEEPWTFEAGGGDAQMETPCLKISRSQSVRKQR
jgi:hypothetical protein